MPKISGTNMDIQGRNQFRSLRLQRMLNGRGMNFAKGVLVSLLLSLVSKVVLDWYKWYKWVESRKRLPAGSETASWELFEKAAEILVSKAKQLKMNPENRHFLLTLTSIQLDGQTHRLQTKLPESKIDKKYLTSVKFEMREHFRALKLAQLEDGDLLPHAIGLQLCLFKLRVSFRSYQKLKGAGGDSLAKEARRSSLPKSIIHVLEKFVFEPSTPAVVSKQSLLRKAALELYADAFYFIGGDLRPSTYLEMLIQATTIDSGQSLYCCSVGFNIMDNHALVAEYYLSFLNSTLPSNSSYFILLCIIMETSSGLIASEGNRQALAWIFIEYSLSAPREAMLSLAIALNHINHINRLRES